MNNLYCPKLKRLHICVTASKLGICAVGQKSLGIGLDWFRPLVNESIYTSKVDDINLDW